MPRSCTICSHTDRDAIEHAAVSGGVKRSIADRYGVSKASLLRHLRNHLPAATIIKAQEADVDRAAGLQERLEDLYSRAERVLAEAEGTGRHNVSLASIRELRNILEFASKLAGLPQAESPTINLTFHDGSDVPRYGGFLRAVPEEGDEDS
jgi:hypothetical protein